jgi:DNA-directed RNA polymerase subunit beta'
MQQVKSTAKGNISNVQALLAGEVQYADQNYKPIPFPVLSSFSEGVEPHEYFAGCFGSRQGLVTLKLGTAVGGYFAKRLRNAANRLVVSARDGTTPEVPRGLPVDTADPHNEGAALAVPIAGYPRNTILTPAIQHALATKGVNRILVRSPLVGGPSDGGVYAYDVGVRDSGALPVLGDAVGQVAIESATEPAVQSLISAKHTGGVAGASTAQEGFPVLDRLVSAPQVFPGAATHARVAGSIDKIEPAPQGGTFMTIAGETHYIAPELQVTRKLGEKVDEGDMLSSGTPNPDDFVRAKGIGEGRRLFTDAFMKANHAAAFKVNRRNAELLARALIDHVELHEEHGPYNPGDIVSYSVLEHEYTPRADAKELETSTAVGQYLEKPVLHLTIGTKITKPLANELASFGVKSLQVHPKPPAFTPVFVRSHDTVNYDPDWMTRSLGTHLVGGLLEGVHRGDTSDATSTSYVPRVASGLVHQPKYLTFPSK